jgi:hypothetical protein
MVIGLGSMALLLFLLSNHSSNSIKNLYQNTAKSLPATTRFSRPEYTVPPPAHLPHVIKVAEDEDYVTADIKQIPEVAEAIIPTVSEEIVTSPPEVQESAVAPVQKYYHSDFPSVFGLVYLPFTIDTPEVKEKKEAEKEAKDQKEKAEKEAKDQKKKAEKAAEEAKKQAAEEAKVAATRAERDAALRAAALINLPISFTHPLDKVDDNYQADIYFQFKMVEKIDCAVGGFCSCVGLDCTESVEFKASNFLFCKFVTLIL